MLLYAHRGYHLHHFENSRESIEAAVATCDAIEFDVQTTACGTPVVFHDDDLSRVYGIHKPIRSLRLEVLQALPNLPQSSMGIPTLAEVLSWIPKGFLINLELKAPKANSGIVARTTSRVLAQAGSHRLIVSSFNPLELAFFASTAPHIPLALLTDPSSPPLLATGFARHFLRRAALRALHPHHSQVTLETIKQAHDACLKVIPWTVNAHADIKRMLLLGVDGLITDHPLECKRLLEA